MKKEIKNAYEIMKPDEDAKRRMLRNIHSLASEENFAGKERNIMKLKTKHFLRIVAAVAIIVAVPAVAYATGIFGLDQVSLGKKKVEIAEITVTTEDGQEADTVVLEETVDMISLQGVLESPEYKACSEWTYFTESYDADGAILSQIGNETVGLGETYEFIYGCYTQEMVDKVDEICKKYQLAKLEGMDIADDYKTLCSRVGIGDIGGKIVANASNDIGGGYFCANGTFQLEGSAVIPGTPAIKTDYQFRRSVKGSFDTVVLNVGNIDSYRQWEYTTENGESVLLANNGAKALIIVEKENSYVVVNVLGDIEQDLFEVSDEGLETLAEMFDFSVIP